MNREPLRVVNFEANAEDHERIRNHAASALLPLFFERVAGFEAYEASLKRGKIDLILADHTIPGCKGSEMLERARIYAPETPYILVSGSVSEEEVADCVAMGACGFVHKDRLERLPQAILRAIGAPEDAALAQGTRRPLKGRIEDTAPTFQRSELQQTQKMELVGNLAGSIAHDFNNLLTIISGYASMLLDKEDLPPVSSEALKRIFTASRQATGLVQQLQLFGRKHAPKREVIDLNTEVEVIAAMLKRFLGDKISVAFEAHRENPRVSVDLGMLEQAIINLASNARDAMPQGGRLTLTVGTLPHGTRPPPPSSCPPGDYAFISVEDSGCGISEENLSKIFEPFFTTKEEGRGTGLGLPTVWDIVDRHGGWIDVQSREGIGSTFRICLPLTRAAVENLSLREGATDPRPGKRTILVVEDEANVREFATAVLQQDGYAILQAKSSDAALEVWKWHSQRIDLLLTDVVLPGELSGPQLSVRLQSEKPVLKVILTTGYSRETVDSQSPDARSQFILNKPYTPRNLLRAVREMLP